MVTIHQLNYPEAQLWAVVPKQEWESKPRMMSEILELVDPFQEAIAEQERLMKLPTEDLQQKLEELNKEWRKVLQEISELEKRQIVGKNHPLEIRERKLRQEMEEVRKELNQIWGARAAKDNLEEQQQRLVARLEELDSQHNLEISSEKTTETEQMTPQELSRAEQLLLSPNQES